MSVALSTLAGGLFGSHKAHKAKQNPVEGAIRGGVGAAAGKYLGAVGGAQLGILTDKALKALGEKPLSGKKSVKFLFSSVSKPKEVLRKIRRGSAGALLGAAVGTFGGYELLTKKYNKKEAADAGAAAALETLGL